MFEIIGRVLFGLLVIIWGVSLCEYTKKKIFENICISVSMLFLAIGIVFSAFVAVGSY